MSRYFPNGLPTHFVYMTTHKHYGSAIDYIYCQDNASYEHIAWLVVPSADNLHPCLAMAYRWMFRRQRLEQHWLHH